jgi:very-short-patch-repair endonuclease
MRPTARRNDARRDAKLRAAGYTVLRFSDVEISERPTEVLGRLPF